METVTLVNAMATGSRRPPARNRILSARLAEREYTGLETVAWSKGATLADWTRDELLQHIASEASVGMAMPDSSLPVCGFDC
jgi:hypothetical protein